MKFDSPARFLDGLTKTTCQTITGKKQGGQFPELSLLWELTDWTEIQQAILPFHQVSWQYENQGILIRILKHNGTRGEITSNVNV